MAEKISYSDGCFLQALGAQLKEHSLDSGTKERLAHWLNARRNQIRKKANGYWKLPAGREEFLRCLDTVQKLLEVGTSGNVLGKCLDDYIHYGMEINYDLIYYGFQYYLHYRAWRHIGYGPLVKQVGAQCGFRNGENIVVWGHPKADQHGSGKKYPIPKAWQEKIRGKKVLLWCPHHTIRPGPECASTWLDFHEAVFAQAEKHNDVLLLWRPHPMLFGALVNNHYMTREELDRFVAEKTAMDNVILDQSEDYRTAFAVSDGLISDGTTFSIEYLYTGKPLMLTTKKLESFYNGEELRNGLYIGETAEDIAAFINDFAVGHDPKRQVRQALRQEMFFIPQGKSVGQNIANNIISDIQKEETMLVRELMQDERKR